MKKALSLLVFFAVISNAYAFSWIYGTGRGVLAAVTRGGTTKYIAETDVITSGPNAFTYTEFETIDSPFQGVFVGAPNGQVWDVAGSIKAGTPIILYNKKSLAKESTTNNQRWGFTVGPSQIQVFATITNYNLVATVSNGSRLLNLTARDNNNVFQKFHRIPAENIISITLENPNAYFITATSLVGPVNLAQISSATLRLPTGSQIQVRDANGNHVQHSPYTMVNHGATLRFPSVYPVGERQWNGSYGFGPTQIHGNITVHMTFHPNSSVTGYGLDTQFVVESGPSPAYYTFKIHGGSFRAGELTFQKYYDTWDWISWTYLSYSNAAGTRVEGWARSAGEWFYLSLVE